MTEIVTPPDPVVEAVPEEVPGHPWVETEAAIQRHVVAFDEATKEQWIHWFQHTEATLLGPFVQAVEKAAVAHKHFVEQAAFDGRDPLAPLDLWRRVVVYRQAVAKRVIAPLHTHLERHSLSEGVNTGCLKVLESLASLAEETAIHETMHRPTTLYDAGEGDGVIKRFRKGSVRARYGWQYRRWAVANWMRGLFRKPTRVFPSRSRQVAVRQLFIYHAHVRLADRLMGAHTTWQQHTARLVAGLEVALSTWTNNILDAERELDRKSFHEPAAVRSLKTTEEAVEHEPVEEHLATFQRIAEELQKALDEMASVALPTFDTEAQLLTASAELQSDLERAGTFLLNMRDRRVPIPQLHPVTRLKGQALQWATWHKQAANRLALNGHMLALRANILRLQDTVLNGMAEAGIRPVIQTFRPLVERLRAAEEQVIQSCEEAESATELTSLSKTLRLVQVRAVQALQRALDELPVSVSADETLGEVGTEQADKIRAYVEQLPKSLVVHPLPVQEGGVVPTVRSFGIDVQVIAREALTPLTGQLQESAQALRKQILHVWEELEQVQHIVQYNIDVALDEVHTLLHPEQTPPVELSPFDEPEEERPAEEIGGLPAVRKLATDGVRRAADTLDKLTRSLDSPWQVFSATACKAFLEDWATFHRRIRAEALVEEQLLDLWMLVLRRFKQFRIQFRERWKHYVGRGARLLRFGRLQARQLVEKGRSAVGGTDTTTEEQLQTIDALCTVQALQRRLPLIYRKLFSFDVVSESSLFEGRKADLGYVVRHIQRWRSGQVAGTLVLPFSLGAGRLSFLHVLRVTLQPEYDVRLLHLEDRLLDTASFAAQVIEVLDLSIDRDASLDDVEAHLLAAPRPEVPKVCMIDNLEHLFLRVPHGSSLIKRVLTFFSRTNKHVFWVATTGVYSWHFLAKTAPAAANLVMVHSPTSIDRKVIESLIINRHRRSGMKLSFVEPPDLTTLVRQRLRRAKNEEARQAILRQEYFDLLHKVSGENIMLALFYWIRSADFTAEEETLTVQPLEPLNFSFLQRFDLTRAFTLIAFLRHNTLTLEEHNRLFRMTDAENTYVLESLLNMRLIEPCRTDLEIRTGRIVPGERYCLHPLILHPVIEYLKGKHIIY